MMERKLIEMKEFGRKVSEYENQIQIITQEKERI